MRANVIHIITMLELGGAQENTIFTVSNLDREKFQPSLWSGPGGILTEEAKKLLGQNFEVVPNLIREISPINDLRALVQLWRMLRLAKKQSKGTPLIIHTHSSKAGILGRIAGFLAGVPIIIHSFHGFGFNDFQPWLVRKAYILAEKIAGLITDSFIFVSRANLQKASQLGIGKPSKYNLIRSGISIDEFKPRQIDILAKRKELGVGSGKLVVMVSNLKPQKNPLDFARVANLVLKKTPDAWFILCGDGELRPELERMIEDFGIKDRVKLLGWRRDIPEILWASDLLILTSLWEGLPRVYPQAMASGLAIVGTRVDGGPEAVIDGENGYLLEPGDYQGISQRVIELLEDDEKRKKMGQRGMEMVAEFDIHKMVQDQEQLYQRLLKEKNLWN